MAGRERPVCGRGLAACILEEPPLWDTAREGGTSPATQYDQIAISGAANLGGTLNVGTFGGFNAAPTNSFTLLTYGSQTGTFGTTSFPSLLLGIWSALTGPTAYTITNIIP